MHIFPTQINVLVAVKGLSRKQWRPRLLSIQTRTPWWFLILRLHLLQNHLISKLLLRQPLTTQKPIRGKYELGSHRCQFALEPLPPCRPLHYHLPYAGNLCHRRHLLWPHGTRRANILLPLSRRPTRPSPDHTRSTVRHCTSSLSNLLLPLLPNVPPSTIALASMFTHGQRNAGFNNF